MLEYANTHKFVIDEFIEVEISSTSKPKDRKIDLLLNTLNRGDLLLVAELSRLGRNMLETLNLIDQLSKKGITIRFIRQPELSTDSPHTKLLFAFYGYFAETEREFISMRTKQGLAAARASGKKLGRPKGSRNKGGRVLDPYKEQIINLLKIGVSVASIAKIVNDFSKSNFTYNTFRNYINDLKNS